MSIDDKIIHKGGCHCGAVRFEVKAPTSPEVLSCTCSMCAATGFTHLIVPGGDFQITTGKEALTKYRFNTGTAQHLFCSICGVKAFYVPRSHPDGWSVNVNCIDKGTLQAIKMSEFDGANWEANIGKIK